jgi:N-methylhydantoinase A
MTYVLGIDIGGTFTDVMLVSSDGKTYTSKVLNTPSDPTMACLAGTETVLANAQTQGTSVNRVIHATTRATNEVIERKRPPVALLISEGFRDLFSICGSDRRDLYDLGWNRWNPPIGDEWIYEVPERVQFPDRVVKTLQVDAIHNIARQLRNSNVAAVAVCLLHAYVYPNHEREVAQILRSYLPDAYIALSSEVWPEPGEYDRAVATVLSAYIGPVMRGYLSDLQAELRTRQIDPELQVMQSNGGSMSVEGTIVRPLFSIESGPAAGVIGAGRVGSRAGFENLITFDMGGTTAKVAVMEGGRPSLHNEFRVGGLASGGETGVLVRLPVIDLAEVGAGGGSIAWVDSGGALQVGPRSAGAKPGPACYGFGGQEPTVTDANLILGYLSPSYFLGGDMELSLSSAEAAIERLAQSIGSDSATAAANIHDIVNLNMEEAMRIMTIARGKDPRDYVLMAFGGAGPTHAARLAEAFGLDTVIVPAVSGVFSTVGLTSCDLIYDDIRTISLDYANANAEVLEAVFQELEESCKNEIDRASSGSSDITVERSVDVRRQRQPHSLNVSIGAERLDIAGVKSIGERYAARYEELYGITSDTPLILQSCRVRVTGRTPTVFSSRSGHASSENLASTYRPVYFREWNGYVDTPVYRRHSPQLTETISGPTIIEEAESTTVVPPGWKVRLDHETNLLLFRS